MGAAESVVRNVDKRTARREHRDAFIGSVREFRRGFDPRPAEGDPQGDAARPIRVCVRKRPMFEWEWKKEREFDVITGGADRVVIHDARMEADMRRMYMDHHEFDFDTVFDEKATNDDVYAGTAAELVRLASEGGQSTVLMYGQTGSGKTYTMSSVYERAAADLFGLLGGELAAGTVTISVSFVELAGDRCRDMLNPNQQGGREVKLCTGRNGEVHPVPVTEVPISSPQALVTYIDHATSLRATCATGVHDQSSRSHAVCRVYINRHGDGQEGTLTLVDLAGSEQKGDSMYHDADRRKEGAAINSSLMALKAVVRERVKGTDTSSLYRNNKLTQLLKTSFCIKEARTVVIATVSPSSKDTEHSLSTLRHACIMDGQGDGDEKRWTSGGVPPNATRVRCGEVDVSALGRERRAGGGAGSKELRGGATRGALAAAKAKQEREYSAGQWSDTDRGSGGAFGDAKLEKKKQEQARALERRKGEVAAMKKLPRPLAKALVEARAACASGAVQRRRLERGVEPEEAVGDYGDGSSAGDAQEAGWIKDAEGNWVREGAEEVAQPQVRPSRRKAGDANKRRQLTAQIMSDATTPAPVKLRQLKMMYKKKGLQWSQQDEDAAIAVAAECGQELYASERPVDDSGGGVSERTSRPSSATASIDLQQQPLRHHPLADPAIAIDMRVPCETPPASSGSVRSERRVQNSPPRSPGMDSTASSRRRERASDEAASPLASNRHNTVHGGGGGGTASEPGCAPANKAVAAPQQAAAALENLSRDDAIALREIRQQRAKAAREENARKAKAAAEKKLRAKEQRAASGTAARPGSGMSSQHGSIGAEIQRLEEELAGGELSAATAHGKKKRLATLKASIVREQRKQESARRQAAKQQQIEAEQSRRRAAAAATAAPKQAETVDFDAADDRCVDQTWEQPVDQTWTPPADQGQPREQTHGQQHYDHDDRLQGHQHQRHVSYGYAQQQGAFGASAAPWGNAHNDGNDGNEGGGGGSGDWDSRDV
jgi:kinesin family protein 2/24